MSHPPFIVYQIARPVQPGPRLDRLARVAIACARSRRPGAASRGNYEEDPARPPDHRRRTRPNARRTAHQGEDAPGPAPLPRLGPLLTRGRALPVLPGQRRRTPLFLAVAPRARPER